MHNLLSNFRVDVNPSLYLKDPESSSLGQNIIKSSIDLIDLHGIEEFNFKKLAKEIGSTESSIYRYFENKQRLLLYLSSLYWGIMEFQLVMETNSMKAGMQRLMKAVEVLFSTPKLNYSSFKLDGAKLRHIINSEFVKAYHNKHVDEQNKAGYFSIYKRLVLRISELINDVNASYSYSNSLSSMIIEGSLNQYFLSEHFHSLTDCHSEDNLYLFYEDLLTKTLKQ
ncbi:helix-turn-helix domain-containing protein [Psychroflexus tropicus]|uniref:helix-turn-helix domain-containing protein n=1 Tax=Psychroflexus tropicus TaxID=197345 RepID=UPI000374360B|nr:helix-turn-helix domain-containing protein [Psychroflexus tropicus]